MSEMVERVARAMMAQIRETSDERLDPEHFRRQARAAIEAMREPTDTMWKACEREQAEFETGIGWRVMIDEALK